MTVRKTKTKAKQSNNNDISKMFVQKNLKYTRVGEMEEIFYNEIKLIYNQRNPLGPCAKYSWVGIRETING